MRAEKVVLDGDGAALEAARDGHGFALQPWTKSDATNAGVYPIVVKLHSHRGQEIFELNGPGTFHTLPFHRLDILDGDEAAEWWLITIEHPEENFESAAPWPYTVPSPG